MKTYVFHSPKTAGNTIACLNLALAYQWQNPQTKVGLLSLSRYPDITQYLGQPAPTQTLSQLIPFIGTDEWQTDLLKPLTQNHGIDLIAGPQGAEWEDLDGKSWHKIWSLLSEKYDVIFVDLGRDISAHIHHTVLESSEKLVLTTCLDPVSLNSFNRFLDQHSKIKSKTYLLLNQTPRESKSLIKTHLKQHEDRILGLLPTDSKRIWDQVYKGFPLVLHKKSFWKNSALSALEKLTNTPA